MKSVYRTFLYHGVYLSPILCYYMCVSYFDVVLCPSSSQILATPMLSHTDACLVFDIIVFLAASTTNLQISCDIDYFVKVRSHQMRQCAATRCIRCERSFSPAGRLASLLARYMCTSSHAFDTISSMPN